MNTVIKVENLSKQYRLGNVGLGSLGADMDRWWQTKILGREDPYLKIGQENNREVADTSGYVWALQDINFDVQQGEVLGIIGRNGAGKSTLLKILSRVTGPTTGSIKIKGRVASLLEVGTGFHPELTGRENIFLNGAILGMTKTEIRSKLDEIVDFAGVEKYVDTPVKRYSSGMYVRLAFAVAAHLEPEILIVDEVLAVGDVDFQKKAVGKMKEVSSGQGRTVLFVSHNMASVRKLCNRGIVLKNGSTAFEGTSDEAVDFYLINNSNKVDNLTYTSNSDHAIIQKVWIDEGTIVSGKELAIHFKLNAEHEKNINLHVGVYDFNGEKILHLSSEYFNEGYLEAGNINPICRIKKNPLPQGVYSLNIGIELNKKVIERLEECLNFEVINGDFFGNGIILRPSAFNAKVLANYEWK